MFARHILISGSSKLSALDFLLAKLAPLMFSEKELIKSPEFQKKELPKTDKFIHVTITKKPKVEPSQKTSHSSPKFKPLKKGELSSKMYRLGALKFFEDEK